MMGEELNAAEVTKRGLLGDRAYALVDSADGKVVSAKNPRKWPQMFDCRATLSDVPKTGVQVPPVRITLPDGTIVNSDQPDIDRIVSNVVHREVKLGCAFPEMRTATAEEYWPDIEGLDQRDTVIDFGLPEGTFFDCALVHVLTTATLDRLRSLYPEGRQGFRGECLDRAPARDWGCRSSQHHWPLSALRHDNTPSGRPPKGYRCPAYSSPAQPG
jgi:uncharacterized protein YcbX